MSCTIAQANSSSTFQDLLQYNAKKRLCPLKTSTRPGCITRLLDIYEGVLQTLMTQIKKLEARLTSRGPTWIGFCHNDTQYGNMLLHTASSAETEARKEHAEDLMTTRSAFDEEPSGAWSDDGSLTLGTSPPSYSYLKARKVFALHRRSSDHDRHSGSRHAVLLGGQWQFGLSPSIKRRWLLGCLR